MIGFPAFCCIAALAVSGGGGAEFHSAYVSRGKVNVDRPTVFLDANTVVDTGSFGFAQIGWWDFSSPTERRQHGDGYRHKAFVENDVYGLYGYDFEFMPEWHLRAKAGFGWYILNGFTRPNDIVERDVVVDVEFRCPYLTLTWFSRSNYWPRNDTSMTLGLFRPVELGCGFTVIPGFLLDGGNHRWVNQRHAANLSGESICGGFTSMSFHLELQYRVSERCRLKLGCRQMDIFDRDARRSVDNSGCYWLHNDFPDVFFGVSSAF